MSNHHIMSWNNWMTKACLLIIYICADGCGPFFPCLYVAIFLVVFRSDDCSLLKHVCFLPRIEKKKCKKCVDRKNTAVSKAGLKADQCGHPHRLRNRLRIEVQNLPFLWRRSCGNLSAKWIIKGGKATILAGDLLSSKEEKLCMPQ